MDFSAYTAVMLKTFFGKWIIFVIMLPICIANEFFYLHSKKKMTKAENRSKQQQSDIMIFLLILVVVYCLINSLPILKDCIEKNYTMAHGEYTIETAPATKSGLSPTEWVVITTDDGARIVLDYPRGKDLSELPDDTCYGAVWYSENSHYILEFIPDEPENNSPTE